MNEPVRIDAELDALAAQLPAAEPSSDHAQARQRLLDADRAARTKRRRVRMTGVAVAASIAAVLLVGVAFRLQSPQLDVASVPEAETDLGTRTLGTIAADPGASWSSQQAHGVQTVALRDGRVQVRVVKLRPDERFLVTVGDAQVEVRGTVFEVRADADRLVSVVVHEGAVDVRVDGRLLQLVAGERWDAQPRQPEQPEQPRLPKRGVTPAPTPAIVATLQPTPAESDFVAGWNAYRAGDFDAAATSFARTCNEPSNALAGDACYWQSAALLQAGRWDEAEKSLRHYLSSFPEASRAGQAALDLGNLLANRGQPREARAAFERAAISDEPSVQRDARDALRRLPPP